MEGSAAPDRRTTPAIGERAARHATIAFDVFVENALSPEFQTAASRAAAPLSLLLAVAGCSVFKTNEEAQAAINQRVVGMSVGDFIERYGSWKARQVQPDGAVEYAWISAITTDAYKGFYGLDDRTCRVKIIADKNGRILTATIVEDMPGRTTTSRCLEIFKAT